jgi:L-lactate dehydrogenase complex protein LldG
MANGRDAILGAIRRGRKRGPLDQDALAALEARLTEPQRNLVPQQGQADGRERLDLFVAKAEAVAATVDRVASLDAVPSAVAGYLKGENLPARLKLAPDPRLDAIPWDSQPTLDIARGKAEDADEVGLTGAFCGVAETGTLIMCSGPEHPTTLNFMPDTHVVVLRAADVVGGYEDAWDLVRQQANANDGLLPRNVNMVTGPSRTGDIEQTIYLGAHGPRRLHIVLVDGDG